MVGPLDLRVLAVGLVLSAVCGWSLLTLARSGIVKGRMGGAWARDGSPATYWLSVATLAAGLSSGAFLLVAGLGATGAAAASLAVLVAAGALIGVGLFGRRGPAR
jgi:hypothetical protein